MNSKEVLYDAKEFRDIREMINESAQKYAKCYKRILIN